ncbi:MAG: ABC transporter ATP-binding protein, partial [Gemmatimonadota bacterium]|nr:ABC transporter ATP-binding protein [Gemmatimonadota bacterium]
SVEVDGLSRRFGALSAVADLRFTVTPGELFGIVGPDGAGKTTTLRMLAGVLSPTAGDARLGGVSVARQPERAKLLLAYMSQRFGLYTDLTVQENLDFYADLQGVPRADRPAHYDRLFAFSGLAPFRDRLAGALSGGMKQKLGLSCALVHQPSVLLLDEPTFGVDPISRRDLWLIVHGMVAEGMTVLVSTAYLDEAERCDRLALLHEGRVVALDTPGALQGRLAGRLRALRTNAPRRARDLLRDHASVAHATLFGETLHVTLPSPDADWDSARQLLAQQGVDVLDDAPIEASLEDVFLTLTTSSDDHRG